MSEVTPAGVVSTFASGFDGPDALAFDAGNLYVINGDNSTVSQVSETVTVPFALGGTAVSGTAFSGVTASPLMFGSGRPPRYHRHAALRPRPQPDADLHPRHPHGGRRPGQSFRQHPDHHRTDTRQRASTPTPHTSVPPVFLSEQRVFSGKGKHKRLVGFEVRFNAALNAGDAQSTGNYQVTQKNGRKVKTLPVTSASYSDNTITIAVRGFKSRRPARSASWGWSEPTALHYRRS